MNSPDEYEKQSFKNNPKVMALLSGGGYSDVVTCHKDHIMPIPPNLDFKQAAAIPETWLTSYQLLNLIGKAQSGDTCLIHAAASGIG